MATFAFDFVDSSNHGALTKRLCDGLQNRIERFDSATHLSQVWVYGVKRKVGRVIDRAGLEIRYTLSGYRGFESLTFRQKIGNLEIWVSYFFMERNEGGI